MMKNACSVLDSLVNLEREVDLARTCAKVDHKIVAKGSGGLACDR